MWGWIFPRREWSEKDFVLSLKTEAGAWYIRFGFPLACEEAFRPRILGAPSGTSSPRIIHGHASGSRVRRGVPLR
jgi:hypothetical protein